MKGKFLAVFLTEAATAAQMYPDAVSRLLRAAGKAINDSEEWDAAREVSREFNDAQHEANRLKHAELDVRRREARVIKGLIGRAVHVDVTVIRKDGQ